MNVKNLKVGIVGCGGITEAAHIPSLSKIKNCQVVAVCDKNEQQAEKVAKKFRIQRWYADFSKMLENEGLEVIHVCTPPQTHASLSIQAMEAGCHVLTEKVMTLDLKEADEMVYTSRKRKVKLGVVHNVLYEPMVVKARSMVEKGEIGELRGMIIKHSISPEEPYLTDKNYFVHKLPGGEFGELLPHLIYLTNAFMGKLKVAQVYWNKRSTASELLVADEWRVILEGEKGVGTLIRSTNSPYEFWMQLCGTKMNLYIDFNNYIVLKQTGRGHYSFPLLSHALTNLNINYQILTSTLSAGLRGISGKANVFGYSHSVSIRKFIESIQNDSNPPVTGEQGRENVRVFIELTYGLKVGN